MISAVILSQIYNKSLNKQLVILNSKDWAKKGPNQIKYDLRMFCEKLLLIHYFLVNLRFFLWEFCVF